MLVKVPQNPPGGDRSQGRCIPPLWNGTRRCFWCPFGGFEVPPSSVQRHLSNDAGFEQAHVPRQDSFREQNKWFLNAMEKLWGPSGHVGDSGKRSRKSFVLGGPWGRSLSEPCVRLVSRQRMESGVLFVAMFSHCSVTVPIYRRVVLKTATDSPQLCPVYPLNPNPLAPGAHPLRE